MANLKEILKQFGRYDPTQNTLYMSTIVTDEVRKLAESLKILVQPDIFSENSMSNGTQISLDTNN